MGGGVRWALDGHYSYVVAAAILDRLLFGAVNISCGHCLICEGVSTAYRTMVDPSIEEVLIVQFESLGMPPFVNSHSVSNRKLV